MQDGGRRLLSRPLAVFNLFREQRMTNPRLANFSMSLGIMFLGACLGSGAEKLTLRNSLDAKYEALRKAERGFVPFFLADYSYKFPQVKKQ